VNSSWWDFAPLPWLQMHLQESPWPTCKAIAILFMVHLECSLKNGGSQNEIQNLNHKIILYFNE
jgi:hypothetical protein